MLIETLLESDQVCLPSIHNLLVIKRESFGDKKIKLHVASVVLTYHFSDYLTFFKECVRCCSDLKREYEPWVTDHKNLMFGHLFVEIQGYQVEMIIYPDYEIAEYSVTKNNEICIPYCSFVKSDFWSQLQAYLI